MTSYDSRGWIVPRDWREVLGVPPNVMIDGPRIQALFHARAKEVHPDAGGSAMAMAELIAARDEALWHIQNR